MCGLLDKMDQLVRLVDLNHNWYHTLTRRLL